MTLLHNAPTWVFALLIALIWLGFSQTLIRQVSLTRTAILPLAMTALSLQGTLKAFGTQPAIVATWLLAAALAALMVWRTALPSTTRYDSRSRHFTIPGSWAPLGLILCIFTLKFAIGAINATQPALLLQAGIALPLTAALGALSSIFLTRAAKLWRLALQSDANPVLPA